MIVVLWLCRRMSLFLEDALKCREADVINAPNSEKEKERETERKRRKCEGGRWACA